MASRYAPLLGVMTTLAVPLVGATMPHTYVNRLDEPDTAVTMGEPIDVPP